MRSGRQLSFGEAVDLVIHHYISEVDISSYHVRNVTAPDRKSITITAGDQDEQIRVREFNALRDWQRTTMDSVKAVGRGIARNTAGTANPRNECHFVRRPTDGSERARNGGDNAEVAAARAPDRFEITFEITRLKLSSGKGFEESSHNISTE